MKLKRLFFLILAFASSSATAQLTPKRVIITGRIINSTAETPKVLGINFLNPFDKNRKSATPDSLMGFSVQEYMPLTQNMTIAYNDTFINLYVAPGDSVHLVIDAALLNQPNFKWLSISGDHAKLSTQLNLFHHFLAGLPYQKYNYTWSVPEMFQVVKKDYDRYLTAIHQYAAQYNIDPIIINFFKRDVKYGISNWIADYVDAGSDSTSTRSERINMFKNTFFELGNDTNFITMMYPYHLEYYASWKTGSNGLINEAVKPEHIKEALEAGAKILLKESPGISRDYMMFSYLSSLINKTPALQHEIPALKKYFTDPAIYQYFELSVNKANNLTIQKTVLSKIQYLENDEVSTIPNVDFLNLLSTKYPGKVIYLDVYATWCMPCLKEMEFAPALHEKFAGKDVVFVNLCLQSTEKNWQKLIKEKKIKGENYFLDDDNSKTLMGNFNIGGFPAYLLIDNRGKTKTANASRPSELKKLSKDIQDILSK
ncbi:TlpA family protein disulfide reductase [Pedobacter metabolipauper]|uniref:Thiol-disulfide isomerase/thioredoxin n=1 Tax=Pedobacter metabolipauper TaxID=425513 RepID=A0A4R6SQF7_9SPHI|nr:TlpA disulfide reductase family protein [Pedobacter metabolipauper]TDQ06221.1 thiol-disulfide isomerase/thioredoxin [Pedobacter metabolipauper]